MAFWEVYVGIFEMGLTFLLWNKAAELTDNTAVISNLIFFTPFCPCFISSICRKVSTCYFFGLLLIVFSNLLQKGFPGYIKEESIIVLPFSISSLLIPKPRRRLSGSYPNWQLEVVLHKQIFISFS